MISGYSFNEIIIYVMHNHLLFNFVFILKPTTEEVEDRFATLRPAQFVARQMQEHKGSDAYREQLQVYKR